MTRPSNQEMLDRMTRFGIRVCRVADSLPNAPSSWVLAKQVIRSATSVGANYQEAQRSRSNKEFMSKLYVCLQEAEETRHWLRTIEGAGKTKSSEVGLLIGESSELIAVLVASINTIRRRARP
ncbi:MAG TPA: four helix bundle protein [Rhodothermales bacterium]|nr:four helix bundle protein [Rhodothermales bacterium]